MKENIDSDFNPAMLASHAFETIIDKIRNSNLNFQLQLSPYSAQISLKNSLVTEKTGAYRRPPPPTCDSDTAAITRKNMELENELGQLKAQYNHAVEDCEKANTKIKYLEAEFERVAIKHKNDDDDNIGEIETLQVEIKRLVAENMKYSELVEEQKQEINDLENSVKTKTGIANQVNKKLNDYKIKSEKDHASAIKSLKAEIKSWKKELGEERKEKINLEKKLEKLESEDDTNMERKRLEKEVVLNQNKTEPSTLITCSLCASPIPDYKPKYFLGEQIAPACDKCDDNFDGDESRQEHNICEHASQCVIRQPYPPPSPSSPFLFHEVSKYHVHMMNTTVDDLTGCIKCFSVDNENYGCNKCTWLKWWFKWHGDRHGFPDIHPSVYRKYQ